MSARPGESGDQPDDERLPAEEAVDDVPAPSRAQAASTWVPIESPELGTRPAWLPPGTRPGQPYPSPYGEGYGAPGGGWQGPPYGGPPPYGTQPPPYGAPPPYGTQPGHQKPRMPRWAKIVLVVGVGFYALSAIWQMFSLLVLQR